MPKKEEHWEVTPLAMIREYKDLIIYMLKIHKNGIVLEDGELKFVELVLKGKKK